MIFDTHTHIYLEEFKDDIVSVTERAAISGVTKMMLPNVDCLTLKALKEMLTDYPSTCIGAMGLHPTSVKEDYRRDLDTIYKEFKSSCYVAVGEIGLDFYWDSTYRKEQIDAFTEQLLWGKESGFPVIVHCRNALKETLSIIDKVGYGNIIMHSFGGSSKEVKMVKDVCEPYFGVNGIVTFKNANLYDTVKEIGIDRLLTETDAPYLAPVPYRGKRNEPSFITSVIAKIAEILAIDNLQTAELTYKNACNAFGLAPCNEENL